MAHGQLPGLESDEYFLRAADMRRLAERAAHREFRVEYQRLSEQYEMLARAAKELENRPG